MQIVKFELNIIRYRCNNKSHLKAIGGVVRWILTVTNLYKLTGVLTIANIGSVASLLTLEVEGELLLDGEAVTLREAVEDIPPLLLFFDYVKEEARKN